MTGLLLVALGSGLGGISRYWLGVWVTRWLGGAFPWGTLAVNLSGAMFLGVLLAGISSQPATYNFLILGFCGSYTTVSSFSLQTLQLLQQGSWPRALLNLLASLLGALLSLLAGLVLGGWLL